jgi:hypothetical protein
MFFGAHNNNLLFISVISWLNENIDAIIWLDDKNDVINRQDDDIFLNITVCVII